MDFNASFPADSKYHVKKAELENGKLRVYVAFNESIHNLPKSETNNLSITMHGGEKFDILVTENAVVKCESKPERSIKVSIR